PPDRALRAGRAEDLFARMAPLADHRLSLRSVLRALLGAQRRARAAPLLRRHALVRSAHPAPYPRLRAREAGPVAIQEREGKDRSGPRLPHAPGGLRDLRRADILPAALSTPFPLSQRERGPGGEVRAHRRRRVRAKPGAVRLRRSA